MHLIQKTKKKGNFQQMIEGIRLLNAVIFIILFLFSPDIAGLPKIAKLTVPQSYFDNL